MDVHELAGDCFSRPQSELLMELIDYLSKSECSQQVLNKFENQLQLALKAEEATTTHSDFECFESIDSLN